MTHTPTRVNVNNGFGTTNDDIPVTSDVVLAITDTLRSAGWGIASIDAGAPPLVPPEQVRPRRGAGHRPEPGSYDSASSSISIGHLRMTRGFGAAPVTLPAMSGMRRGLA